MEITQIIEKVKKNLLTQEELKSQLDETDACCEMTREEIARVEEKLSNAEIDEMDLKDTIIEDLKNNAVALKKNLSLYSRNVFGEDGYKYGIQVRFMDKKQALMDSDYELYAGTGRSGVQDFVEKIFNDYLTKGETIFNNNNINKLLEIKKLYDIRPEVVKEKLVSMTANNHIEQLQKVLDSEKEKLAKSVAELKDVEKKIKKTPSFKSDLLKKVFTRNEKLQEKRETILFNNENSNKVIKDLENRVSNKAEIREEASTYVQSEIDALMSVFAWIDSFEVGKYKLQRFTAEHIEVLTRELEDLKEKLAHSQTTAKEIKGMLQVNKKVNNDIVSNALMNKIIISELNAMDMNQVEIQDQKAVKFIENKYNEYLQGCVESLVK